MKFTSSNGVRIYNVTTGKSMPDWLSEHRKESLRKVEGYRNRIELLQDFDFPTASGTICASPDGAYLLATGTYKPQIKLFDLPQLSMKCERHIDSDVIAAQFLSADYRKLMLLRDDRTIEFHAQYGRYYQLRFPKPGHCFAYNNWNCDVYVGGESSEVFRLNLDEGRFMKSYQTRLADVNAMALCTGQHYMLAVGGTDGAFECWDTRNNSKIATVPIPRNVQRDASPEITALTFATEGLHLAVGTSDGRVLMYDIRSTEPVLCKQHMNFLPIKKVLFADEGANTGLNDERRVLSADARAIKIWQRSNGENFTTIESEHTINDVCQLGGVVLTANEHTKCGAFYVPELGHAPPWCSFLDNLTEELEEDTVTIYDDYKFVTLPELKRLGLENMIGTPYLRAYMHGYFMDARLYAKVLHVMNPFAFDEYRKGVIKEKLDAKRSSRIATIDPALYAGKRSGGGGDGGGGGGGGGVDDKTLDRDITVNKRFAEKLLSLSGDAESVSSSKRRRHKKHGVAATNLLGDDRFKAMFTQKEYAIDKESEEYKKKYTVFQSAERTRAKEAQLYGDEEETEAPAIFGDGDGDGDGGGGGGGGSGDDGAGEAESDSDADYYDGGDAAAQQELEQRAEEEEEQKRQRRARYGAGTSVSSAARRQQLARRQSENMPLRARVGRFKTSEDLDGASRTAIGRLEMTFTPAAGVAKKRRGSSSGSGRGRGRGRGRGGGGGGGDRRDTRLAPGASRGRGGGRGRGRGGGRSRGGRGRGGRR